MREIEFRISPEDLEDQQALKAHVAKAAHKSSSTLSAFRIIRKSLDARKRPPVYLIRALISEGDPLPEITRELDNLPDVSNAREVHIIGAGPAGYFAALECIKLGLRPIVLDRGLDVQARRKDLRAIQQDGVVNPHSNYCFGEGGAGTYSDGKLYTRSGKRGNIQSVLQTLVECGADPGIMIEAHPHIGSNKLPPVIAQMRTIIERQGGEVKFNSHVTNLITVDHPARKITGIEINGVEKIKSSHVVLATGHSARDIFSLLKENKIFIEAKPFALGVRIEHPQSFIDYCQYGMADRGPHYPASSYALNAQVGNRGVFSFCMCPGGLIVPAATSPGEIVVNGMSLSRRDSAFANSGIVTAIELEDLQKYFLKKSSINDDPLIGVEFQKSVEQSMFNASDGTQAAPAQRLTDFLLKKESVEMPESSYIPGLISAPLHSILPQWIVQRLMKGFEEFEYKMEGYIHPQAVIVATESRTSSPVRIPRHPESGMHLDVEGLFPCGEGAGYAGGIMSAAMDGQFIARMVADHVKAK
jgi:uncharacterized FAD-dependent dehydrogenase